MRQPTGGKGRRGGGGGLPGSAVHLWRAGWQNSLNLPGGVLARSSVTVGASWHICTPGMSSWWGDGGTVKIQGGPEAGLRITNRPLGTATSESGQCSRLAHLGRRKLGSPHAQGRRPPAGCPQEAASPSSCMFRCLLGSPVGCALARRAAQQAGFGGPPTAGCAVGLHLWGRCTAAGPRMACMPAEQEGGPCSSPMRQVALQRQACTALSRSGSQPARRTAYRFSQCGECCLADVTAYVLHHAIFRSCPGERPGLPCSPSFFEDTDSPSKLTLQLTS